MQADRHGTSAIRATFIEFYRSRGHLVLPSASLVPDDPTVLLTIAGMVPLKPYFLGVRTPPSPRLTSAQRCVRTNDIGNVGKTARHLTSFEMLGNFSIGDYFKPEAVAWAWDLLVTGYGLDPARLWVTVYEQDGETAGLWLDHTDVDPAHIVKLGADDNYWWTGQAGPGGPCTEIYYDRGEAYGTDTAPGGDSDRFLEIYNLVFMQHEVDDRCQIVDTLPSTGVDTGLGRERLATVLQGADDVFSTDLYAPVVDILRGEVGITDPVRLRICADHLRTSLLLLADGVLPGNSKREYVLRRMIRRIALQAHLDGVDSFSLPDVGCAAAKVWQETDPHLAERSGHLATVLDAEQRRTEGALRRGTRELGKHLPADPAGFCLPGEVAFKLHDSLGFPLDLTEELVTARGGSVDVQRFSELMTLQRHRSR